MNEIRDLPRIESTEEAPNAGIGEWVIAVSSSWLVSDDDDKGERRSEPTKAARLLFNGRRKKGFSLVSHEEFLSLSHIP